MQEMSTVPCFVGNCNWKCWNGFLANPKNAKGEKKETSASTTAKALLEKWEITSWYQAEDLSQYADLTIPFLISSAFWLLFSIVDVTIHFFMLPTYQSKINTHSHWACNDSSTPKMFTLNTSCESAIWWCYILQCKREELQCVQYVYKWTASFFATFCKQAETLFVQTQMTALHPSVLSSLCRNINYLHIFPLSWCPIVNVGLIKRLWLLVWQIKYPSVHLDSMQSHWQHTSCELRYQFWLRYASLQHLPLSAVAEIKHLLEIHL